MQEPLSDKITTGSRETAAEQRTIVPVEREVRLDGAASSAESIRKRLDGGFYHTPAVADVVARQIIANGDLAGS